MQITQNNEIDKFIINASLIDPIAKIINQLTNKDFRDCDINWLDDKLATFTEIACKSIYIKMPPIINNSTKILNEHTITQYIQRFTTLLNHFKSF